MATFLTGSRIDTLGLSPEDQFKHGISLVRDAERVAMDEFTDPTEGRATAYAMAGLASCLTALWREQRGMTDAEWERRRPQDGSGL